MSTVAKMLETYPQDLGGVDSAALTACIEACVECAQACTACADACLSEQSVQQLTTCVRTNLDCADVCATTAAVLSRHTGYDANVTRSVVQRCADGASRRASSCLPRWVDLGAHQSGDGVGGLLDLRVRLRAACVRCVDDAVSEVIIKQGQCDRLQRTGQSAYLGEDIDAVLLLLDHPLHSADLTFDASDAVEVAVFTGHVAVMGRG